MIFFFTKIEIRAASDITDAWWRRHRHRHRIWTPVKFQMVRHFVSYTKRTVNQPVFAKKNFFQLIFLKPNIALNGVKPIPNRFLFSEEVNYAF